MQVIDFKQFPSEIQYLAETNDGFQKALRRLEVGSKPTPRSWFYENIKDPNEILGILTSKLEGMKDLRNIADWDLSKSDKFGPQGGSAPLADRLDSLEEYFIHLDPPQLFKDPLWKKAKLEATRRLKFNESGSPITAEAVVARGTGEHKYNTSSGYPLWKKRKTKEAQAEALEHESQAVAKRYPFVLGTRASMGKTGVKARNIFMAPMALNVHGQRYLYPLQDWIRRLHLDFFAPWEGWENVQNVLSQHWTPDVLKFGTDYSKMDQHFNVHHGLEVFDVVKHYFNRRFWDDLKASIEYTFNAPIITNLGYIDQPHSMPSGSEWTNFLESLYDYILGIYLEMKYHLRVISSMGIGDDQLYFFGGITNEKSRQWILKTIVEVFSKGGTPGNEEKQEVGWQDSSFLQRYITSDWSGLDGHIRAAGVYSLIRNATSQVFPEFYHNEKSYGWEDFAIRCIQIGENAVNHPLAEWYVKEFMANANPNILRFVKQKDSDIIQQVEESKSIANFLPTYNQAKMDKPLIEYQVFKWLREIA